MKALAQRTKLTRFVAAYVMVAVFSLGMPLSAFAAVGADIKANGADGTVTINNGDSYTYDWSSTDSTACTLTSPSGLSGISINGSGGPIGPGHAWYPSVGSSVTLTLDCTDGTVTSSDSVTIRVVAAPVAVTADIKANGADGTVTITSGSSWSYSWSSTGATACTLTSPSGLSGISINGSGGPIDPAHPWYPTLATPTTLTLDCTDGTTSASDSVVVNLTGTSTPVSVTADIKANGSDGPVTITSGSSWNYSWTSTNATACTLTSPSGLSGISINGSGGPIDPSHPWYPTLATPTTLTLNCTNGTVTATDVVVINLASTSTPPTPPTPPSSSTPPTGSSRPPSSSSRPGEVSNETPIANFCPFLTSYLRIGRANDPEQVLRLQVFLKMYEGYDYVEATGVFDEATLQAVNAFQLKYASEILAPWEINAPTGYVYIRTLGKINQLLCGSGIQPVHPTHYTPVSKEGGTLSKEGGSKEGGGVGLNTLGGVPLVGTAITNGSQGQNTATSVKDTDTGHGIAAALFSWPSGTKNLLQTLYEFLLILVVLYILGSVMESVLYKDIPENVRKRHWSKWLTILIGLGLAFAASMALDEDPLLLPLIIAFLIALGWSILKNPKKPAPLPLHS